MELAKVTPRTGVEARPGDPIIDVAR
jgi:hypothetical protein